MSKPNQLKPIEDKIAAGSSDNRPTIGVINTICWGTSTPDSLLQKEDTLTREVWAKSPIVFSTEELNESHIPCDDPIVVSLTIAKYDVHRILVDNGSSTDILFYDAFVRMKISRSRLQRVNAPLVGFTGSSVQVEGTISLPVTAETKPRQCTVKLNFLIVRVPSAYNGILR